MWSLCILEFDITEDNKLNIKLKKIKTLNPNHMLHSLGDNYYASYDFYFGTNTCILKGLY